MDNNEFDDLNGSPQDLPRGNCHPDPIKATKAAFSPLAVVIPSMQATVSARVSGEVAPKAQGGLRGSGVKRTSNGGANPRGNPPNHVSNVHQGGGRDSIFGSLEDAEEQSGGAKEKAEFGEMMKKSSVDALKEALGDSLEKTKTEQSLGLRPLVDWPST
jgi:hypothetical protein